MAVKHYIKNESGVCIPFYPDAGEQIPVDSNSIHVIDASGMPTKEEIRDALTTIEWLDEFVDNQGIGKDADPQLSKVVKWLESLAKE